MPFPRFEFARPQKWAAVLLLCFLLQCLWVVHRQNLTQQDYRYAQCGREMWERPNPLPGYFTSCGNIHDGTLAYRAAGLPLTLELWTAEAADHLRKPENRIFTGEGGSTSSWEMRHEVSYVLLLMRLPFIAFGMWLGGGLWWVTRRLFGNEGGFLALSLYCFSPAVLQSCLAPNNDVLAMWGLYGTVYTAIGVAHAMQGPRRKWKPRIVLLVLAVGLTAASHIAAALLGLAIALGLMMYLAEGRRGYVLQIITVAVLGATAILFASYAFHADAFSYVARSGAALVRFSPHGAERYFLALPNAATTIATGVALLLLLVLRRARYFGNVVPLSIATLLMFLATTQVPTQPWLWALPFLLTFVGGVFADVLETRQRKLFLWLAVFLVLTQAVLSMVTLPALVST